MLRRIHIRNYKSLVDLEVTLDSLVVVFGPNGAGKSNFLDALQLLSRMATSRTLTDAFEPPYREKNKAQAPRSPSIAELACRHLAILHPSVHH